MVVDGSNRLALSREKINDVGLYMVFKALVSQLAGGSSASAVT